MELSNYNVLHFFFHRWDKWIFRSSNRIVLCMAQALYYSSGHTCHHRISILGMTCDLLYIWTLLHTNFFSFQFFFYGQDVILEDKAFVTFALFNVVWVTLYLETWKRKSSELAFAWGTADLRDELLAEPRPQFKVCNQVFVALVKKWWIRILFP